MKSSGPRNRFELENLEPRILLSADTASALDMPDERESGLSGDLMPRAEVSLGDEDRLGDNPYQNHTTYDPSHSIDDIFDGLTEDNLTDISEDENEHEDEDDSESAYEYEDAYGFEDDFDHDQSEIFEYEHEHEDDNFSYEESVITSHQQDQIVLGLNALLRVGRVLETFDAYDSALASTSNRTLGAFVGLVEIFHTRLAKPVYDYFNDSTDPPDTRGLLQTIEQIHRNYGDLEITVDSLSGGMSLPDDALQFNLKMTATRRGELRAAESFDVLSEHIQEKRSDTEVAANLQFDFSFGLDLAKADEFFLIVHQFDVSVSIDSRQKDASVAIDAARAPPDDTHDVIAPDGRIRIRFDDTITADGRITLDELQSIVAETGKGFISLDPADTDSAEPSFNANHNVDLTDHGNPTLSNDLRNHPDLDKEPWNFALISDTEQPGVHRELTEQDLGPVIEEAIRRWSASSLDSDRAEVLDEVNFRIVDLPGGMLGQTRDTTVLIDASAAGHGWFVDGTPADDAEFEPTLNPAALAAAPGSPARGRMDLLTVIMHELGHVHGYEHPSPEASHALGVMASVLSAGRRNLLDPDAVADFKASGNQPVNQALTAEAFGPYVAAVGEDIYLDGTESVDPDAAGDDVIQTFDWEIEVDQALDYDFDDGYRGDRVAILGGFASAGTKEIGLRVTDPGGLTAEDVAIITIHERLVTDLAVRPKGTKIQLTWTKAGAEAGIYRSESGPNHGFVEIARTQSDYATYLDTPIELNKDYYYRVYVYAQVGDAEPIGISAAEVTRSVGRVRDTAAPAIAAGLVHDTGTDGDGITADPTIAGTITDINVLSEFWAWMDGGTRVDVRRTAALAGGDFILTAANLEAINGGPPAGGAHTVSLQAVDRVGNVSPVLEVMLSLEVSQPPVIEAALVNDTGRADLPGSTSDGVTRDPTIAGSISEAGNLTAVRASIERVFAGFTDVTDHINDDGSFTFDRAFFESLLGTSMEDGDYTLRMEADNAFGQTSDLFELPFTLDTNPPPLSLELAADSDTGVPGDSGTALAQVTLEGLSEAGARVELFRSDDLGIPLASTLADGAGSYSFPGVTLSPGENGFTSVTTDAAGNDFSTDLIVQRDAAAPNISGEHLNDTGRLDLPGTASDRVTSDPTVGGAIADAHALAAIRVSIEEVFDGFTDVTGDPAIQPDGSFVFDRAFFEALLGTPMSDGAYTLRLEADDTFGNTSTIFELPFSLDTTVAAATLQLAAESDTGQPGDHETSLDAVTLEGLTEAGALVELFRSEDLDTRLASTLADGAGSYSFSGIALALGENAFTVRATDAAGNDGTAEILVERTVPIILTAGLANDTDPGVVPPAAGCTFDNAHSGWSAHEDGGSPMGAGGVRVAGCEAVLVEGDSFIVSLERPFVIPDEASKLTVRYRNLAFDTTADFVKDAFEMALVDSQGNSLVHTFRPGRDAFFNIAEGFPPLLGTGKTSDGETVTVDLSGLFAGTSARLVLRLVNNDSDVGTTVRIGSVDVSPLGAAAVPTVVASSETGDGITSDPTIVGLVTSGEPVVSLAAAFDAAGFAEVLPQANLQPDGAFVLDFPALLDIFGGPLTEGDHVLHLQATDANGLSSDIVNVAFSFDSRLPRATFQVAGEAPIDVVEVVYNEDMADAAFALDSYAVRRENGPAAGLPVSLEAIESLSASAVRIRFSAPLITGLYGLTVGPAVTDLAGNPVASPTSFGFAVTGLVTQVSEFAPFNGEEMVSPARRAIVRFDGEIDPTTVDADSLYLIANGTRLPGTVRVSSTNRFATFLPDEALPASTEVLIVVDGDRVRDAAGSFLDGDSDGVPGGLGTADFRTVPLTRIAGTNVWGYVFDSFSGVPIEGATIRVDAFPEANAVTDATGFFELVDMPAPDFFVHIDGSTATSAPPGTTYPSVGKPFHSVPGQSVQLEMEGEVFDVFLPPMAVDDIQPLNPTESTDIGFGPAGLAELQAMFPEIDPALWSRVAVTFPAGSAIDDAGNSATEAVIIPVPPDRIPAPLPRAFADTRLVISIQAGSATSFDVPAPIAFPNLDGLAPGQQTIVYSFNHAAGRWDPVGTGTVSEDGLTVISDPGVGILAPGWHIIRPGVVVRGGLVLGLNGGLFGRSGGDVPLPQTGLHYWAIENLDSGFVIRGSTNVADRLLGNTILGANTSYRLHVLELIRLRRASVDFVTPGDGSFITAPTVILERQLFPDNDGDGLDDPAEFIVGTAVNNRDTDGDGISDLAELRQGLNPFDDRGFPTGIVSTLPLFGEAAELVIEGSITDPEQLTAYVATGAYGLALVDVSRFDNPIVLGQLDLPGDATDVAVDPVLEIAAVAANGGGLHLVDVSDPMLPVLIQTLAQDAHLVEAVDGVVYAAVDDDLKSFELRTGNRLQKLNISGTRLTGLTREGLTLYTMDTGRRLQGVDISGFVMIARASLDLDANLQSGDAPGGASKLFVANGLAYAPTFPGSSFAGGLSRGGYATVDVSNPDSFEVIGQAANRGSAVTWPGADFTANGSGLGLLIGSITAGFPAFVIVDTSDPANTTQDELSINVAPDLQAVEIAAGIGFTIGPDTGLHVVNYQAFDTAGVPPTATVSVPDADVDPGRPGIQVQEGSTIAVLADLADDVQVRNVELLLDGRVIASEAAFPWDFAAVMPVLAQGSDTATLQVRATDTGGNVSTSDPLVLELVPDTFAPTIIATSPGDGFYVSRHQRSIQIAFSDGMDPSTLTPDHIRLLASNGTAITPIDFQIRGRDAIVQLTFASLALDRYDIVIEGDAVTDRAGNPLATSGIVSSFTVADADIAWINPIGGAWRDPDNWDTERLPGPGDEVIIGMPSDLTISLPTGITRIQSLRSINDLTIAGATLLVADNLLAEGELTVNGATIDVGSILQFNMGLTLNDSTLRNATVLAGNSSAEVLVTRNTTLDNLVLEADLRFTSSSERTLTVRNGLVLNRTLTVAKTGSSSGALTVSFAGTQTLSGTGTVVFGSQSRNEIRASSTSDVLTIGAGITIRADGGSGDVGLSRRLVNQGTIVVGAGFRLEVTGTGFVNEGLIRSSGGTLLVGGSGVVNAGTIEATGGTLRLSGSWKTIGTMRVTGVRLELRGSVATAELARLERKGGTVRIAHGGTLDNRGALLDLTTAGGPVILDGGTVFGGTITGLQRLEWGTVRNATLGSADGSELLMTKSTTFDNVVLEADLRFTSGSETTLTVRNGLVLNGILTIASTSTSGRALTVEFVGSQTLSGTGTVVFGTTARNQIRASSTSDVLAIGAGITIRADAGSGDVGLSRRLVNRGTILVGTGFYLEVAGTDFVNEGLIRSSGGTLRVGGSGIVNAGTIEATGGTLRLQGRWTTLGTMLVNSVRVELRGSFTTAQLALLERVGGSVRIAHGGTLDNRGAILDLTTAGGPVILDGGTVFGGTITGLQRLEWGTVRNATLGSAGGSELLMTKSTTFDNVVLEADLRFTSGSELTLTVRNGLVLNGILTIASTSTSGRDLTLEFVGSQTLSGTGTVVFGTTARNQIRASGTSDVLTIGAGITIRADTGSGYVGLSRRLVNQGTIVVGAGFFLEVAGTNFVNEGSIQSSGGTLRVGGSGIVNAGTIEATGGTLRLEGRWTTLGTMLVNSVRMELRGSFTTAQFALLERVGGSVRIGFGGTLDNRGALLDLTAVGGPVILEGGTVFGGAITGLQRLDQGTVRDATLGSADGSELLMTRNTTLDNVVLDADLRFTSGSELTLTVRNGLVLNGILTIASTSSSGRALTVAFAGTQTLSGTGTVVFGTTAKNRIRAASSSDVLTIGPGIAIRADSGRGTVGISSADLVNQGRIVAAAGFSVTVTGKTVTNEGTIEAGTGGSVTVSALQPHSGSLTVGAGGSITVNGNFTQNPGGMVDIDIGGTASNTFGRLIVTGNANLAGTLNLFLVDGFEPVLGNSFSILTFGSRVGEFDVVTGLDFPNSIMGTPVYTGTDLSIVAGGTPLQAVTPGAAPSGEFLTLEEAKLLLAEAMRRWSVALGISAEDIESVVDVDLRIDNLQGAFVGFTAGSMIWLDDDAAGNGWFVDPTPSEDGEFDTVVAPTELRATVGAAAERVDLLTTLIHEVGHRLGQSDNDEPFHLMNRIIETGIRRLPSDIGLVVTTGANAHSRGTDFWLTFPANAGLAQADPELSLVIMAEATTTGTVSIPGLDFTREFVAVPGLQTTVVLPLAADLGFTSDRVTQKGIHVSSASEITVFGVSRAAETSDVFLGLPIDLLGTDYIVLGYPNVDLSPTTSETFPGTEFAIVAGQDGTTLTITPAIATGVHAAGVPYIVSLNRGETYQLQNFGFEPADLSGTIIQSDRPIAVFGGHAAANIPAPAVEFADYLVEQLPPVNLWGTQFLSAPFATRGMGDTFRFLASEDNTVVSVNGAQVAVLERGQLHEVVLTEASEITADRPILVAQYANSAEFDGTRADPFMLLLTPSDQLLDNYRIFTGVEGIESEFVNLLVPNDALGTVLLDGAFLPVDPFEPIGTSGFSNAQIAIEPGTHRITGPVPFGLYTYGFGLDQAYGYPGGWAEAPGAPVVVADLVLTPSAASLLVGTQHTVTARAGDPGANPIAGVAVQFAVSGAHEISAVVLTDNNGLAVFSYEGVTPGPDRIEATVGSLAEVATATWSAAAPTIEVLEPVDGSSLPAGETALIVGRATHGPATEFVSITVDGRPVDTFDSEGNFFHRVTVAPGHNHFELLVIDGFGQTAGTTLSLTGAQPSEREAEIALLQTIVSSSFVAEYGRTSFDESGRILHVDLAVRNDGTYVTDAPIFVAIDHLSDPGIRVAGFNGTTPEGLPYYDFSDVVANGSLLPGELSGSRTLAFFNPEQIRFTFDLVFFGQLNEAPAITSIPDIEAVVGNAYHYAMEAEDPDGDPLGFSLLTGPAGMVIDSVSQRITWTPTDEDAGTHAIAIRAEDGRGGTVEQRFSLAVVRAPPNRPPFFRSAPRVDANVNTLYRYEPVALDSDSDPLTFELIEAPAGLTLDRATGVLEWTPTGDDFGSHDVGLEVADSRGGAASQTFVISVRGEPGNNAPVIFSQPPATATQDKDFVYEVDAIDPDADVLGFALPTAPAGMTIDEATGEVVWDGASVTIGEHQVTVQVTDGRGGFDTQIFTVGAIANRDPVIISTPILEAREGQTYGFFIEAGDPDGNPLTFGLIQAPSGMSVATIDEDTGLLTWTPAGGQLGPNAVTLEVSDGRGGSAGQAFVIEVGAALPNQQPTITSAPLTDAVAGRLYDHLVIAFDPDGDLVSFELLEAPDGMVIEGVGGRITWTPSADQEFTPVPGAQFDVLGLAHVSVQASDGRGGIDLQEFDILVRAIDNLPPRIDSIPPEEAVVGALYRYDAFGSDPDGDALTFELLASAGQIPEDFGFESGVLILTADGLVSSLEERGIPAGMTLDPETGVLLWTPQLDDVIFDLTGPYDVREVIIRASDGKGGFDVQSFPITVRLPNAAPVITSTPPARAHVGLPFLYDVAAQDFDRDELSYALGGAPAGMAIDAQTGKVRWTPSAAHLGDQPVTVLASDGRGGETQQSFNLTVVADAPNNAPIILSTPRDSAPIGREYRYLVEVSDPDADPLNVVLETGPLGLRLDNEQRLVSWIPDLEQLGRHQVTLRVEDGRGGLTAQSFTLEAVTGLENARPEIVSTPPLRTAPDQLYAYDVEAVDADGDLLAYQLTTGPVGMSIDVALGTVRWEPSQDQVGEHAVRVEVFDQYGLGVLQSYIITVGDSNRSPALRSVPPTTAAVDVPYFYTLDAADPNGDPLGFDLLAAPAGMTLDAARRLIEWTPDDSQIGTQDVEIAVSDGFGGTASQRFAVEVLDAAPNQPPQIISTPPLSALVSELYAHDVDAVDPEGGAITFSLRTAPDGMVIEAETGILQWTPTVQQLPAQEVAIVATDDAANGAVLSFTIGVFRDNQAPAITSDPDIAIVGLPYSYDVEALDPDGDPLTYGLLQAPEGMTIDSLGRITWLPGPEDAGTQRVEIAVEDPFGAGVTQTINLPVLADSQAPLVQLVLSEEPVLVDSNVTFTVTAVDDVRIAAIGLRVGGEAVVLDADGRATLRFDTAAEVEAVATAIDIAGNRAEAVETILVVDPSDATAPVVSIASPVDGDTITSFVDIIGTVDDDNLLSYTLSVAPLDGEFTEIVRRTEPVVDGVLGTFDPTMFTNDMYEIRLEARDAGGNVSEQSVFVSVAGDLKLGNFTLSFDDLVIPVSGIPITVSRTYDTLTADRGGDFGFGWRLEFAETRLRTSIPETGQEVFGSFSAIRGGDRVYATLPGGRRVGFTFEHRLINPVLALYGFDFWEPVFAADPGVTEELTVPNVQLGKNPDGSFFALSGNRYNPANPIFGGGYTLTTSDGIVYDVDGRTGDLRALGDLNGNTLTFTEDGIFSSTGEAVLFERDPQGRIVAVVDPMGNRITYAYDDNGDLVAVTDRERNTTEFHYNADRAHFLEEVIDPLGRRGIRSEYDDNGRLIRLIDAGDQVIELVHDPENSLETVIDARGNPTVYEYDTRGNVITEVDALGGTTTRTYDENNFMLSETNPLGHTTSFTYDNRGNVLTETDPLGNVTRFTYGSFGRVLTTTDPLGHTTTYTYDRAGNQTSITNATGETTRLAYDTAGNLTSLTGSIAGTKTFAHDGAGNVVKQTDALGNDLSFSYDANGNRLTETLTLTTPSGVRLLVTTFTYDADGRSTSVTDAEGGITRTEYDAASNVTATIDALGRRTEFRYEDRGLLVETIFPDDTPEDPDENPRQITDYDQSGNRVAETDEAGRTTRFVYDELDRLVETIFPDGTPADPDDNPRSRTEYDRVGQVTAEVDERGNRTEFEYDAAGNQVLIRDALGNETRFEYDASRRLTRTIDSLGRVTHTVYDDIGRPLSTILPDGSSTSQAYDKAGRLTSRTDQVGNSTHFEYDGLGRLIAVVDALQQRTEYMYDEAGNLIRQIDASENAKTFEYDGVGRRIATVLPLGQRSTTRYDAAGNFVATTDFNGDKIIFEYDARNRLLAKRFPGGSFVEFSYTATGLQETITEARGVTSFEYDERNRLLRRTDPDGTAIAYTYDKAGNRLTVTVPSGATTYTYDALNRIERITDSDGGATTHTYDTAGRLVRTDLANGTFETRAYDDLNRVLLIEHRDLTDEIFLSFEYTLNEVGDRVRVVHQDGRQVDYEYDKLRRLMSETITRVDATVRIITYIYDPVGNRLTRDDSAEGLTTYTYDNNDRVLTETLGTSNTTYTYDDNGNTLSKVTGADNQTTYEWDFENRLLRAVVIENAATTVVEYQYDADGIRVAKIVDGAEARFLVDKIRRFAQLIEEYTPDGTIIVSYIYGIDLISQERAGVRSYYHVDGLGTTRALTDVTGVVTDRYTYDAFGRTIARTGTTENAFQFAGEQRDSATRLDYLRARYLDAGTGRFVSRDPFSGFVQNPLSLHSYLYASANPVSNIDPSGLFTLAELNVVKGVTHTLAYLSRASTLVQAGTSVRDLVSFISLGLHVSVAALQLGFAIQGHVPGSSISFVFEHVFQLGVNKATAGPFKSVGFRLQISGTGEGSIVFAIDVNDLGKGFSGGKFRAKVVLPGWEPSFSAGLNFTIYQFKISPFAPAIAKVEAVARGVSTGEVKLSLQANFAGIGRFAHKIISVEPGKGVQFLGSIPL